MKNCFSISCFLSLMLLHACAQTDSKKADMHGKDSIDDPYFKLVSFDALHIHPVNFPDSISWKNAHVLTNEEIQSYGFVLDSGSYRALQKFYFSKNKNMLGYLLGEQTSKNHITIHLLVYDINLKKQVFFLEAASYNYLPSAMEKIRNSWITDLNNNGTLDIATREFLEDFELPTEDAPNTTGETSFMHIYKKGEFEYQYWKKGILPDSRLIK